MRRQGRSKSLTEDNVTTSTQRVVLLDFEKYFGRTHGGIGCLSSQANRPLTEKELHQLRMDEEALKGNVGKEEA
ncbi:hypothetical protein Tco_0429447 [Tanacetum coccineum]